ncbi:SDR family NAD(P)-dependent oxidoreductase [Halopelagius longus]|uniref:3-hydroxybutyrate dehydrogenase n=1 Tax=Halopelagius longus TaxID=1236180 RepID=A0A1H1DTP6_9EURY|nr:SDR family NAD(P)-dependent oxidoreductase [Halopelagius longus]RDI71468.1 SDR family NAD(P)-dependent oxidoreductase [Halopelagius longus]SDQ79891.1 3-hydroxybutyrate dehydrogenase [Halopelagius longus]
MADPATVEFGADDVLVLEDDRFGPESVCLVTGAASGIGRATAAAMATNGLTVVGTDVDGDGLASMKALVEDEMDAPGEVVTVEADLTDDDEMRALVEEAATHGDVRYLANIAGMQHISPLEEFPMDVYDTMHEVMVRAPFLLSKLVMPHVRETDDGVGAIGNMCSIHGHVATQDKAAYITSKFALRGLTKSIAAEGEGALRAFTVSTSYVSTPLVEGQIPDTAEERGISEEEVVEDVMLGGSRVKDMMRPIQVANLFAFGFSKHGQHLDGADMTWDGGHLGTYE